MAQPPVSVITLNWNRKSDLRDLILSLRDQTFKDFEIIVIDNGSTDGSAEMVEKDFSYVRLVKLSENLGIGMYNRGFEIAKGEYLVLIDTDSLLVKDGIEKIVQGFERDSRLGVIACKVINYFTKETAWDNPIHLTKGDEEAGFEAIDFNGCAAGIRKEVINRVGGFPEDFFLYFNEVDFCLRVLNAGYDIRYFPGIFAEHKTPSRYVKSKMRRYYETRNYIWIYLKYGNLLAGLRLLWVIARSLIMLIFSRPEKAIISSLNGVRDAVLGFPFIFKLRRPLKNRVWFREMRIKMRGTRN